MSSPYWLDLRGAIAQDHGVSMKLYTLPRPRWRAICLALALSSCPALGTAIGAQVRPLNLDQMTRSADRIFSGRCVDVRVAKDPKLDQIVTYVKFVPDRSVKGGAHGSVTIKMLGNLDMDSVHLRAPGGPPQFHRGEEVILFLYRDSRMGLTSPVGFGEGKFSVLEDKQGRRLAINGSSNENLFHGLTSEASRRLGVAASQGRGRHEVPADSLLDMVEALQRGGTEP